MGIADIEKLNFKASVLADQVSRILTDAILEGTLKGRDQLVEMDLQKQFGISRTPLREAFRDLEKKGLVVIEPHKGTFVRKVTRKDIEENFPVRANLEGMAAKFAFMRARIEIMDSMSKTIEEMKQSVKENDINAFRKSHENFHETFIRKCGNQVLKDMLKILRLQSMWYLHTFQFYSQEDFNKSITVHEKILELFVDAKSDCLVVEQFVRNHIEVAFERFLLHLDKHSQRD